MEIYKSVYNLRKHKWLDLAEFRTVEETSVEQEYIEYKCRGWRTENVTKDSPAETFDIRIMFSW